MKKIALLLLVNMSISTAYASIPYCAGTKVAKGTKHRALQYVINRFAKEYHCNIETSCILNFDKYKYAVQWKKDCPDSANMGNDPAGSTFYCSKGECTPLNFGWPLARY